MISGQHFINGEWIANKDTFSVQFLDGTTHQFSKANAEHVNKAALAANEAFATYGYSSREMRSEFLNCIADEIEQISSELIDICHQETALPKARLEGETNRTTSQLRFFASHILSKEYLDIKHDEALLDRKPMARPEMFSLQRPIGPVGVFGASNFPLAFSVAGGDTASALAAGCPVIVKSHQSHPATSELVAQAIESAMKKSKVPLGTFSLIQGNDNELGTALVSHELVKAIGFTGGLKGGRALYNLCANRDEPIAFFGELGSVNPVFILPNTLKQNANQLASSWAQSLTMGVGQFCTNPGVVIMVKGDYADIFMQESKKLLSEVPAQTMLNKSIASSYKQAQQKMSCHKNANELLASDNSDNQEREVSPSLYATTAKEWVAKQELSEEAFGPLGVIVLANNISEMLEVAHSLTGQLTCTIHMEDSDIDLAHTLLPILEQKAGRILANGFPTGVEICDAMVHGGPYPASTNFGATAVGSMAIKRFLRLVCYQNLPHQILPTDLQ